MNDLCFEKLIKHIFHWNSTDRMYTVHSYVPDMVVGTITNPNTVTVPEWFIIYGENTWNCDIRLTMTSWNRYTNGTVKGWRKINGFKESCGLTPRQAINGAFYREEQIVSRNRKV